VVHGNEERRANVGGDDIVTDLLMLLITLAFFGLSFVLIRWLEQI
jgi:hypothetical protein